jgi:cell pole-organizing protein PopZ
MNQARGAQEPTMEEILSSIRRIISEDGRRTGEGEEAPAAPAAPEAAAPAEPPRAAPPAGEADDVLELTEIAPEEPAEPEPLELVEEAAEPELKEPSPPREPEPESRPEPAVAAPSMEPVPEPAPVPPAQPVAAAATVPPPRRAALAPVPEPEPEAMPEAKAVPELEIPAEPEPQAVPDMEQHLEPLEVSLSAPSPEPAGSLTPEPSVSGRSRLMSEATEIASAAALSVLAQVVQPGRGFTEEGRRMVDQIMRERLEVHLREWMDGNLSALVERIVREEIARLVERSLGRSG